MTMMPTTTNHSGSNWPGSSTVVVVVVFAGYRKGHNPDTLVGPVVTTTGDVFGVLFLLAAVRIVLALGGGG